MYWVTDRHSNAIRVDAVIEDAVVPSHGVAVQNQGMPVHRTSLNWRNGMHVRTGLCQVAEFDEHEKIGTEVEVEVEAYRCAVKPPPMARNKVGPRRQWCPAAVRVRKTPAHPCRRPSQVRKPNPAIPVMPVPPPVMKRRPTPRIIRAPIPAGVRVHPLAALPIRPPLIIEDDDVRLPTPSVTLQCDPCAIRGECVIKVNDLWRRIGHVDRLDRRGNCVYRRRGNVRLLHGVRDVGSPRLESFVPKGRVPAKHGGNKIRGHTNIIQVDEVVRLEVKRNLCIFDEGENHFCSGAGLRQRQHLLSGW